MEDRRSTTWTWPQFIVRAVVNERDFVELFTVIPTVDYFNPVIPHLPGKTRDLQLGLSRFSDVALNPRARDGIYPPNGRWSYVEVYEEGPNTSYRTVIVGASFWTVQDWRGDAADIIEALRYCCTDVDAIRQGITLGTYTVSQLSIPSEEQLTWGIIEHD